MCVSTSGWVASRIRPTSSFPDAAVSVVSSPSIGRPGLCLYPGQLFLILTSYGLQRHGTSAL